MNIFNFNFRKQVLQISIYSASPFPKISVLITHSSDPNAMHHALCAMCFLPDFDFAVPDSDLSVKGKVDASWGGIFFKVVFEYSLFDYHLH